MKLVLTPVRMDAALTVMVSGDLLTLDGVALDFAPLPPGAVLPRSAIASPWIAGDVTRAAEGLLTVPLILPHGPVPWPPTEEAEAVTHPAPIYTSDPGPVVLPALTPAEEDKA